MIEGEKGKIRVEKVLIDYIISQPLERCHQPCTHTILSFPPSAAALLAYAGRCILRHVGFRLSKPRKLGVFPLTHIVVCMISELKVVYCAWQKTLRESSLPPKGMTRRAYAIPTYPRSIIAIAVA